LLNDGFDYKKVAVEVEYTVYFELLNSYIK